MPARLRIEPIASCNVVEEAEKIQSELEALRSKGTSISARRAADYLSEISRLYFTAAQQVESREEAYRANGALTRTLSAVNRIIDQKERNLPDFLNGAHGIYDVTQAIPMKSADGYSKAEVCKHVLLYNAVHWGAVGELHGAQPPMRNEGIRIGKTAAAFDSDGRLAVTPRLLKALIDYTPHLFAYNLGKIAQLEVTGTASIRLGNLFAVLRSASNSLHSLKLQQVSYRFRGALADRGAIENAITEMTDIKNLEAVLPTEVETYAQGTQNVMKGARREAGIGQVGTITTWERCGMLAPAKKYEVLQDLLNGNVQNYELEHFLVLSKASGLPRNAAHLFKNYLYTMGTEKRVSAIRELLRVSKPESRLCVSLGKSGAVVLDSGLGITFERVRRKGESTSGDLQRTSASIQRKFMPTGARVSLAFKRI